MTAFETEIQAIEAIGLRDWEPGSYRPRSELALLEACAAAGVQLGAYDRKILGWLAGFEPQACAVIANIVLRAGDAG
ncbi:MAG: hypothetical protein QOK11_1950 [Pseudonocardiales bacterium]|nr:hypothetical protein [Pseudonocardiales bacterium]